MRIPSQHLRSDHDHASVAMTPMIDIVFLLLIFFVCAAVGVVQEQVLATDLAATGGVESVIETPEREPWELEIRLTLARDPASGITSVDMNGTRYADFGQLERQLQALAQIDASNPVILDVSPGVEWGAVIDLYDRCRRVGLATVNFAIDAAALQRAE
ncbi:MAG: ExbD/TolR family protein [Planctomycetaceae bacterium]